MGGQDSLYTEYSQQPFRKRTGDWAKGFSGQRPAAGYTTVLRFPGNGLAGLCYAFPDIVGFVAVVPEKAASQFGFQVQGFLELLALCHTRWISGYRMRMDCT